MVIVPELVKVGKLGCSLLFIGRFHLDLAHSIAQAVPRGAILPYTDKACGSRPLIAFPYLARLLAFQTMRRKTIFRPGGPALQLLSGLVSLYGERVSSRRSGDVGRGD